MKKLLYCLGLFMALSSKALANPACAVCTVAIAGSLTIATKLGVDECIVGLWAGAMLAMLGYWTIRFFDKRGWVFPFYKSILMATSVAMVGFIYVKDLNYYPNVILGFLYMDYFLFSSLLGAFLLIFGVNFYAWMKQKNGGHAHFPFEKVVVPIALLALMNLAMVIHPFCDCEARLQKNNQLVSVNDDASFD